MIVLRRIDPRIMRLLLLALTLLGVLAPVPALRLIAAPLLVLVWPGVAVAHWLGQGLHWRDARSWATVLPLGTAFSALIVFSVSVLSTFTAAGAALAIALFTAAVLLTAPRDDADAPRLALSRTAALLIALTVILVCVALAPLRTANRDNIIPMWGPIRAGDSSKHYGIPVEIEATGIPPQNLFYFTQPPQTQVYYIFFYIPIALLDLLTDQLLGISFWLVACMTLTALDVLLLVYALARRLYRNETAAVGALLYTTVLGGLDVLPTLYSMASGLTPGLYPHLDGWVGCNAEISTFFTAYTWVPHHTASLMVLLAAWLIYEGHPHSWRAPLVIALLVVSAVGHSVYVPLGVVAAIGLLALINGVRAARRRTLRRLLFDAWPWALAAGIATAVAAPLIAYELAGPAATTEPVIVPWVRTGSVPVFGLVSGTVVRQFFPQGGILAQLFDLPLYFMIEIGATLLLALLGLMAWQRRWLARAWLIGLLSLVAGILISTFLKSTISCNDLGMRAMFPVQAVLALLAGGGWLALQQPRGVARPAVAAARPRMPIRAGIAWAIIAVGLALAVYQWPQAWRVDVPNGTGAFRPVTGLYDTEGSGADAYRWTRERVGLSFDGLASNMAYQLVVRAASGSRPAGASPALVTVWIDGAQRGEFTATAAPQSYTVDLRPDAFGGQTSAQLELRAATFQPADFGLGDQRDLGVLLDSVELLPAGGSPLALPSWDVIIASACAGFFAPGVSRSRKWLAACMLALAGALLAIRPLAAPALPYAAALLGAGWFARFIAAPGWRAARERLADGRTRWFKMLIAPLVLIGLLTTAAQLFVFDVAKFLPALDAPTARADAYGFGYDEALRAIRTQTRPDAIMQVDPDLGQSETEITVAAHRRSLFVHDNSWLFQTPLAQYAQRRERIQQAFSAPTLVESCSIFRALGIDAIIIEPRTRAYNWLVDIDEPESCFHTLYASDLVMALEVKR